MSDNQQSTATSARRIILTGFMGAGKTTVGRLLAPLLGWHFLDADAVLTERTGSSIAGLFEMHGERIFRELEAELIAELLSMEQAVIALGGGAVEHAGTRARLAQTPDTLVVYLEAALQVSVERCVQEAGTVLRPVLRDTENLTQRFQSRLPFYKAAHLSLLTEGRTPDELARSVLAAMQDSLHGRA